MKKLFVAAALVAFAGCTDWDWKKDASKTIIIEDAGTQWPSKPPVDAGPNYVDPGAKTEVFAPVDTPVQPVVDAGTPKTDKKKADAGMTDAADAGTTKKKPTPRKKADAGTK